MKQKNTSAMKQKKYECNEAKKNTSAMKQIYIRMQ